MKALYRVSDGWIFNADVDMSKLTETENGHLTDGGIWGSIDVEGMTAIEIKRHKVVDGSLVLLPVDHTVWTMHVPIIRVNDVVDGVRF